MSVSAWVMLAFSCLVIYGGLAWGIIIILKRGKKDGKP